MKVVLGCDPLLQPLTGIGHYTNNLGKLIKEHEQIEELKFFAHGKFFSDPIVNYDSPEKNTDSQSTSFARIRNKLATFQSVVKAYQLLQPIVTKSALKRYGSYIFHSPNFILPNFDGKKVVTIHDLSTLIYPEFHPKVRVDFVNQAILHSLDTADHIITDSLFIKNELLSKFSVNKKKVSAVHLGADPQYYPRTKSDCECILEQYQLEYGQYFLFVSTLEPRKNLEGLLDAFMLYREKYTNGLPLILIGGLGWNNQRIVKKIEKLTSRGWGKYLGYIHQQHIPILYSAAAALLFPSVYEGFGLPVLEAMQSGIPVLTSKNSSMQEITQENAALINFDDIYDMMLAIERLAIDSEWTSLLIQGGLARARDFSWDKCANETVGVYKLVSK
ncbi:glycosyltransferase family 4 protein [Thalassotalea piscium]|uniref:Alpha-1,3-rhamnosyl/mannosyltransferase n=1 Tax=Thalassotalea piscium TaxID=1230533 RepID=A0A7X0TT20_9GAMM|nr:glycosyltransferase family 1 protein [Thalassotalea piscium]MBB6542777.1 alpha-1,3-rhamnosyl/mannosyltransferase [Thalassotalea piscium]